MTHYFDYNYCENSLIKEPLRTQFPEEINNMNRRMSNEITCLTCTIFMLKWAIHNILGKCSGARK